MVTRNQEPVLFTGHPNDPKTLSEVIGVGAGAISVCWDNTRGAGTFESDRASSIVDEMIEWINEHYTPKTSAAKAKQKWFEDMDEE